MILVGLQNIQKNGGIEMKKCKHNSIDWKAYPPQCRDCYKSFKEEPSWHSKPWWDNEEESE